MTSPKHSKSFPSLTLTIAAQANHPKLLEGLDTWVQLGLISDQGVREVCQQHLSCPIAASMPMKEPVTSGSSTALSEPVALQKSTFALPSSDVPPRTSSALPFPPDPPSRTSSPLIPRLTQAVLDNFSITWLLFLGVFLVVLSSVVLAASNWQAVSPPGQYSILFGYTLAFWAAGTWTQRQPNLHITSWMLRVATLLIVPINFWMIDGLGLWHSAVGWILGVVAAIALSGMIFALVHAKSSTSFLAAVNVIALSGLHWGWAVEPMPLLATYLGTLGTAALVSRYQTAYFMDRGDDGLLPNTAASEGSVQAHQEKDADSGAGESSRRSVPLGLIAIAFATFLLVIRAVTVGQVPWSQLGLAIGLCGWVLSWISRPSLSLAATPQPQAPQQQEDMDPRPSSSPSRDLWLKGGAKLLLLGWLVSVGVDPPWQALVVSGLGLWVLGDRLLRYWRSVDLLALFLVGLQSLWLMQRLVPGGWREALLNLCIRLSGDQGMPTALFGLTLFPYVLVMLSGGRYLRHRQQLRLGQQADWMALGLGGCLTLVSLLNPVTRSLNLLASTATLGLSRRPSSRVWVWLYLMHGLMVATVLSWIDVVFPSLVAIQWAVILVVITSIEGLFSVHLPSSDIRKTSWFMGCGLGAIAYSLFLTDIDNVWGMAWFLVPLMLIYVGHRALRLSPDADPAPALPSSPWIGSGSALASPQFAGWLSTLALFLGQPFLFNLSGGEGWRLGVNALMLLLCVPLTRSVFTAAISMGCAVFSLWITTYQVGLVTDIQQLYLWTATPGLLWLLWSGLRSGSLPVSQEVARLYGRASHGWAIAITTLLLLSGTIATTLLYTWWLESSRGVGDAAIATSLLLVSLLYRLWHHSSLSRWGRQWLHLGIAWAIGLLMAQLNATLNGTMTTVAIAFLTLGLITQLLLASRPFILSASLTSPVASASSASSASPVAPASLGLSSLPTTFIPLFYGILGWLLSQLPFSATTGLYTLAFAVLMVGVGRRHLRLKPLTILAVGLMTMAIYQVVIYQMQQASGGERGDGLMILSGLATGLAIFYGVGAWDRIKPWFQSYLQLTPQVLRSVAHCHWILANGLGVLALLNPRSMVGHSVGTILFTGLAAYALAWGHQRSPLNSLKSPSLVKTATKGWTMVGIWQLLGAIAFTLYSFSPNPDGLIRWGGAIASLVALLCYALPWQRWGWPIQPWFQTALVLPSAMMLLTAPMTTIPSVLIVAAFYAWLAKATNHIRISYLSIGFISWAILWFLSLQQWNQVLWVAVDVGGALLYIVEVDPALRPPMDGGSELQNRTEEGAIASTSPSRSVATKQTRHILRTLATSLICFASIYQSSITPWLALLTVGLSLALIAFGILLKTRAYLFVGTGTLLFEIIRYTRQFIGQHPLQIWAVGIVLGLAFIWIAATFESRRNQVRSAMAYWQTELASWE